MNLPKKEIKFEIMKISSRYFDKCYLDLFECFCYNERVSVRHLINNLYLKKKKKEKIYYYIIFEI